MTDFSFDESAAVDIGGIDDPLAALLGQPPRFHMTRTRVVTGDARVDFCRIAEHDWLGVIVALGDWTTPAPQNAGPYTAYMDDGAGTSETVAIAMHPWRGRWRWMNRPWPFPATPLETLYAAKLLPRFDGKLTYGTDYNPGPYYYEPLGLAGLYAYMPMTGGRGDIGPVTAAQGWYLCHPDDPTALADVLAQGEAGGTFPWDFHDPGTGTCIDPVGAYPHAGTYAEQHGANPSITIAPYLPLVGITLTGPPGTKLSATPPAGGSPAWNFINSSDTPIVQLRVPQDLTIPASGTVSVSMELDGSRGNALPLEPLAVVLWDNSPTPGVTATLTPDSLIYGSLMVVESAHMPACEYVPYLLTGDPYYLEILQHQAASIVMEGQNSPPHTGANRQPRASGWSARTLAQAARVSPDTPPSWLQPRSVWQIAIDRWEPLWRADTGDNTSDPGRQALHQIAYDTSNALYQCWQEDIALDGLAWLALLHPTSAWPEDLEWLVQQSMARLEHPPSGWPATVPTCYTTQDRPAGGAPLYGSWSECWAATMPSLGLTAPPPTLWLHDADYLGQQAAAMALAWQAGAGCGDALTSLLAMMAPALQARQISLPASYAIAGPP